MAYSGPSIIAGDSSNSMAKITLTIFIYPGWQLTTLTQSVWTCKTKPWWPQDQNFVMHNAWNCPWIHVGDSNGYRMPPIRKWVEYNTPLGIYQLEGSFKLLVIPNKALNSLGPMYWQTTSPAVLHCVGLIHLAKPSESATMQMGKNDSIL